VTGNVRESGSGEAGSAERAPARFAAAAALERLLDGNRRFVAGTRTFPHQESERRQEVVAGQKPFAAILSCSDSRVVPEIIFDQGLGDLFVARVAGNIMAGPLRASLEYAVEHLGVPLILVLGHSGCGAVQVALAADTLADGAKAEDLRALLTAIEPAVASARREVGDSDPALLLATAVRANVRLAVSHLQAPPGIEVVGAAYDLASGVVELL
jgi:carbonic anhydrase